MPACSKCRSPAVTFIRYSGQHLCRDHFVHFVEKRAKMELSKQGRLPEGLLAVALSGGKDSVACLHFLAKITRDNPRTDLVAISIDEGIAGYRDGALRICEQVTRDLGVPWHVVRTQDLAGYTIDQYAAGEAGPSGEAAKALRVADPVPGGPLHASREASASGQGAVAGGPLDALREASASGQGASRFGSRGSTPSDALREASASGQGAAASGPSDALREASASGQGAAGLGSRGSTPSDALREASASGQGAAASGLSDPASEASASGQGASRFGSRGSTPSDALREASASGQGASRLGPAGRSHPRPACGPCGVFRRLGLNEQARELGAAAIATGHNLDDQAQTILMNVLQGDVDRMARLAPHDSEQPGLVPRILPFRTIPEKEILLYAMFEGLPVHDEAECPYAARANRFAMRDILLGLEADQPGTRHRLLRFHEQVKPLVPLRTAAVACPDCGQATSGDVCRACLWRQAGPTVQK